MSAIQFYHLTATPLEAALPRLLEKAYAQSMRVLVKVADDAMAASLSKHAWEYDEASFLPHGTDADAHAPQQPILFSAQLAPTNQPVLLIITDGTTISTPPEGITRVLDMFSGHDDAATAAARTRWKQYKDAGHQLTYYQQTPSGGWEKKA